MKERQSLEAIILRRWDYGEKDLIVSFLSREQGRLQGLAKGAKASLKRFGPALDLFAWVRLQVKERKNSSLFLIEGAEILSNFSKLRQDYASILLATGLLELTHQLFNEGTQEEGAFMKLLQSLEELERSGPRRRVFWSFLLHNFELMGWGLRYSPHLSALPEKLVAWLCNPAMECSFSIQEEVKLQELLEEHYRHHLHLIPDWNRFLRLDFLTWA